METPQISAADLAILLKARDEISRFQAQHGRQIDRAFADFQRAYALAQPDLFRLRLAQLDAPLREFDRTQRTIDNLNEQMRAAMEYDASQSVALAMPALPPPLPPVDESIATEERIAELEAENRSLRFAIAFDSLEDSGDWMNDDWIEERQN